MHICQPPARRPAPTWQLRVNLLRQVLREAGGHLPADVHQHSGLRGGDLVDEDRAGVGQHQLGVVGFKLGTVLHGRCKRTSETGAVAKLPTGKREDTFIKHPTK